MKLDHFLDHDSAPPDKVLTAKQWHREISRVVDVYIAECEKYRREHKVLAEQVKDLAKIVSDLRNK